MAKQGRSSSVYHIPKRRRFSRLPTTLMPWMMRRKINAVLDAFLRMTFPTSRCRCCSKKEGLEYSQKCANRSYRFFNPTNIESFKYVYGLDGPRVYWHRIIDDLKAQVELLRARHKEANPHSRVGEKVDGKKMKEMIETWTKAIPRAEKLMQKHYTDNMWAAPQLDPAQCYDMCICIAVQGPNWRREGQTRYIWIRRINSPCLGEQGRKISDEERQEKSLRYARMAMDDLRFVRTDGTILRVSKTPFDYRWFQLRDAKAAARRRLRRNSNTTRKSAAREFRDRGAYLHKPSPLRECWVAEDSGEDEAVVCRR
ncbi:hypothetical protein B0A52_09804 [Exophiala mesophila]|uniref:Uncharacterized protein n=1 Tax=Exophiala mesophila TaxID=212818 RepID=A0A438MUB6_EXOME|nr:hypothetical protein B0A52_09804 [Exophiala mesophila]